MTAIWAWIMVGAVPSMRNIFSPVTSVSVCGLRIWMDRHARFARFEDVADEDENEIAGGVLGTFTLPLPDPM